MRLFGYARVSSKDQNEIRQVLSLHAFGVLDENIYIDKLSGRDFNRPRYQCLRRKLRCGDLLAIQSIDRLGRNYEEILEQWRVLTKEIQADVVVLDMPLLDTRKREHDLTGTFIADLVLQILSYVAQTERESIRKRQAEGIAAARMRGVRFGAPCKAISEEFQPLYLEWRAGNLSARSAAKALKVAPQTFRKWCEEQQSALPDQAGFARIENESNVPNEGAKQRP